MYKGDNCHNSEEVRWQKEGYYRQLTVCSKTKRDLQNTAFKPVGQEICVDSNRQIPMGHNREWKASSLNPLPSRALDYLSNA